MGEARGDCPCAGRRKRVSTLLSDGVVSILAGEASRDESTTGCFQERTSHRNCHEGRAARPCARASGEFQEYRRPPCERLRYRGGSSDNKPVDKAPTLPQETILLCT